MVLLSGFSPGLYILVLTFCLIVNGLATVLVSVLLRMIPAYAQFIDRCREHSIWHYLSVMLVLYILVGSIFVFAIN